MIRTTSPTSDICPVCGAAGAGGIVPFLVRRDGRTIFRCRLCGAGIVSPFPTPQELAAIYGEGYFQGEDDFFRGRSYFEAREACIRDGSVTGFPELLRHVDLPGKRLLDIGCASGALLVLARERGARVCGVEFSEAAARFGRDRYGLEIHTGTLESAAFPEASFDIVTAIDLLEHVTDPAAFLSDVHRVLSPGGLLLVNTPNFRCALLLRSRWVGLRENMEHLVYFTPQSFRRAVERAGFRNPGWKTEGLPPLISSDVPSPQGVGGPETRGPMAGRGGLARKFRGWVRAGVERTAEAWGMGHSLILWAER